MALPGFLQANIDSLDELYRCYMPFLKNGGLFLERKNKKELANFTLGKEVFLTVNIKLDEKQERIGIKGKVAWINPPELLRKHSGIGIEFPDPDKDDKGTRSRIENMLGAKLNAQALTHTM